MLIYKYQKNSIFVLNIRYNDIWKNKIDRDTHHRLNIESNALAATVLTRNLNKNEVRNNGNVTV